MTTEMKSPDDRGKRAIGDRESTETENWLSERITRRSELIEMIVRNFQVSRQYSQKGSQSGEERLAWFYEGIGMSLEQDPTECAFRETERCFIAAGLYGRSDGGRYFDEGNPSKAQQREQAEVALQWQIEYNLAALYHRWFLKLCQNADSETGLTDASSRQRAALLFESSKHRYLRAGKRVEQNREHRKGDRDQADAKHGTKVNEDAKTEPWMWIINTTRVLSSVGLVILAVKKWDMDRKDLVETRRQGNEKDVAKFRDNFKELVKYLAWVRRAEKFLLKAGHDGSTSDKGTISPGKSSDPEVRPRLVRRFLRLIGRSGGKRRNDRRGEGDRHVGRRGEEGDQLKPNIWGHLKRQVRIAKKTLADSGVEVRKYLAMEGSGWMPLDNGDGSQQKLRFRSIQNGEILEIDFKQHAVSRRLLLKIIKGATPIEAIDSNAS